MKRKSRLLRKRKERSMPHHLNLSCSVCRKKTLYLLVNAVGEHGIMGMGPKIRPDFPV